ncbi:MAG: SRPBCC family protein [Actinobacteria bacterium]|nr:SRPBCC family protein [Actinomycetota bacterium]
MELTNEFRVGVPVARAWDVLTDVERIAPCMPGAELQEIQGDEYRGVVKVKVGPITAQYKGKASFVELDAAGRRAVLRAEGRDTRGAGNANATITATLAEDGDGTRVTVVTDLAVTGKVAQFGRGVLSDVSAKLLDQFVESLERDVLVAGADDATPAAPGEPAREPTSSPEPAWSAAAPAPEPEVAAVVVEERAETPSSNGSSAADSPTPAPGDEVRRIESKPAVPVDLLDAAGGSMAKRFGPAVGAVLFVLWVFTRRRRKRR